MAGLGERMQLVGIKAIMALACGRMLSLDFNRRLATAMGIGEPGTRILDIRSGVAGLGGRISDLGFTRILATVIMFILSTQA